MSCPNCGAENAGTRNSCEICGAPLGLPPLRSSQPIHAHPLEPKRKTGLLAAVAVGAGLAVGAFVFYGVQSPSTPQAPASEDSSVLTTASQQKPAATTQSPVRASAEPTLATKRKRPVQREPSSPPQLLAEDRSPVPASQSSSEPVTTPTPSAAVPESAPPLAVSVAAAPANPEVPITEQTSKADPTQRPRFAAPPAPPAYAGPMAGLATWTGKLEKNGILTITAGTPSTGMISGAGFPGVPVRVTIDQTNLGISEMPNASNGYRRLVLRSHAKHDRIVVHWTVIGQ